MKLKLCGIRDKAMLEFCSKLPVDYLGLNFVSWSKRKTELTPSDIKSISEHSFDQEEDSEDEEDDDSTFEQEDLVPPKFVGIFSDQTIEEVLKIQKEYKIDVIQLHGKESVTYLEKLRKNIPESYGVEIWKAFPIHEGFETSKLQEYSKNVDLLLFDGENPGAGKLIVDNQTLLKAIEKSERLEIPYGIAGGINVRNIEAFVERFPEAVLLDTASGIEERDEFSETKTVQLILNFQDA